MDEQSFFSQFLFRKEYTGYIGVEREYFLTDDVGVPTPRSPEFLERIADDAWTYELSACQVEHRTRPEKDMGRILSDLGESQQRADAVAREMGVRLKVIEVGPPSMPLDIYPHNERYRTIAAHLPPTTLSAACRVTGTHIHIGVRNLEDAIRVHNKFAALVDELSALGDHSNGERLRLYKVMADKWKPPLYENLSHLYSVALAEGFVENPRDCWHLVRISRHGTVELRMFGMTQSTSEIAGWIEYVRRIVDAD